MRASYWTGIGVMLIPIGVVIMVEFPNLNQLAFWLVIGGLISLVAGWAYTIKEERQRRREGISHLYVLASIAEKLGVNMDEAIEKLKEKLDGK
jgi:uncharacterized membrane protein YhaH (DUF805 family)